MQRKDLSELKIKQKLAEDLEFARRTEEALRRIENGKGITMSLKKFLAELKKW